MERVDEQSLGVRIVLILIIPNHQSAVAQRFQVIDRLVPFVVLKDEDLDQIIDLCILHNLLVSGFSDVEHCNL